MKKFLKISAVVLVSLIVVGYVGLKKNVSAAGMEVRETPHFVIHHEEIAPQTLDEIEERLEGNCERLREFFGVPEAEKSTVLVYSSIDRFQRAYLGLILSCFYGDWAVGGAYHEKLLVTSPDQPGSAHDREGVMEVLLHEYVHTLIFAINDWPDIWLDEGLATYLSGQEGKPPATLPPLEVMQSQSMGDFVEHDGYAVGRSYVAYLVETYGREKVVELVRTNDYESSLGKSMGEVYEAWVEAEAE